MPGYLHDRREAFGVGDTGFEPVTSSMSRKRATPAPITRVDWLQTYWKVGYVAGVFRVNCWPVDKGVHDLENHFILTSRCAVLTPRRT